jgi:hypothetical protein
MQQCAATGDGRGARRSLLDRHTAHVKDDRDVTENVHVRALALTPRRERQRMTLRGRTEQMGLTLDRYADGDETTLRRDSTSEGELEYYEEDEVQTLPWPRDPV